MSVTNWENIISIVFNLEHFIMPTKYPTTDAAINVTHNS